MQVTGPSLAELRLFSAKLRSRPQTIWPRNTFGSVEAVPRSWVIVAFSAPVAVVSSACVLLSAQPVNRINWLYNTVPQPTMPVTARLQYQFWHYAADGMLLA